jgi:hypothetical protein
MHKIERIVEKYGLDGLREELSGRRAEGASLRDLERVVNVRVLEAALQGEAHGVVGDAEGIYEVLRGDDVGAGRRAEVVAQLANGGVPVEEIEDDFVSHEGVRTYLRDVLDVDTSRDRGATLADGRDTAAWARARCTAVIEQTLARLHEAGELSAEDVTVTNTVRVTCEESGETYRLNEFLDRGGCR